jgi:hypothetical protein
MNAEGGIYYFLGNSVLGHGGPVSFHAKAPRRKERKDDPRPD